MITHSLTRIVEQLLAQANESSSGRAGQTVYGGHNHALRQTVIAIAAGHALAEHESPGEATLQVLAGHVRMTAGDHDWEGTAGDLLTIPSSRHAVEAIQDSAVLLTVSVAP